jgi:putative ABC transport system substrate-binding protein
MHTSIGCVHCAQQHAANRCADIRMWLSTVGITLAFALGLVIPWAAVAQPLAKVHRIGYLTDSALAQSEGEALQHALRELGYVEGQNIALAVRFAEQPEQHAALAAELVGLKVDVIVVRRGFLASAAKHATSTIPIVMAASADAVGQGLVASLARPGGNVTGLTSITPDLSQKWLALLKEAVPALARVAVLRCPIVAEQPNAADYLQWRDLQGAANLLGLHLQSLEVRNLDDLEALFASAVRERADGLLTLDCVYTNPRPVQMQIAGLAAIHRLPGMYVSRAAVEAGGLMSYTPYSSDRWHRVAVYVDKILKGAKPADLPVEQPLKFDFVINLKTAKALGITIPPITLFQADKVIQ